MTRALLLSTLLVCAVLSAPVAGASVPQSSNAKTAAGPEAVVREFYAWYTGHLDREEYGPLKRRREALKYLTPEFHRRAPRVIAREMVDILICAQDWQPGWGRDLMVAPAAVRGAKATTTATFRVNENDSLKIRLTLRRAGGAWKIDDADCAN